MVAGTPRPQDFAGASHLLGAEGVAWSQTQFVRDVQQRGKAVIDARGSSSAASAAEAIVQHTQDWLLGSGGRVVSMGASGHHWRARHARGGIITGRLEGGG